MAKAKAKAPKKAPRKIADVTYLMPAEVKDWIERASSKINHLTSEVDRLKKENDELRGYRKWAEHRILRSDQETE